MYQKVAADARKVQDPKARAKAMASVRDDGMKIWADKYKNTLAPEVVRRQERATMLGRGETQSGYKIIKRYVQPSVEKTNEAYDVVLDYLLSEGHADTVEEAHYVMMQMDAEYVQSIVEGVGTYKDPVLGPHTPGGKAVRKIVKMGKAAVQGYQGSQAQGLNRLGGAIDAAQKEYQKKVEEQMMPPIDPVAHNKLKRIRKAQELQNKTTGPESDAAGSAVKRLGGSGVNLPPV